MEIIFIGEGVGGTSVIFPGIQVVCDQYYYHHVPKHLLWVRKCTVSSRLFFTAIKTCLNWWIKKNSNLMQKFVLICTIVYYHLIFYLQSTVNLS